MAIARHYVMSAADGKQDEFIDAVREVIARVSKAEGCQGIELLQDIDNPHGFVMIERWDSPEAHQKGRDSLPPGTLDRVVASRLGMPTASYLNPIATA